MSLQKVYIVEDSPLIRRNLVAALEELAPVVVVGHADTAAEAQAWLAVEPARCDLAIVDVFLRQGTGIDVLRALHALPGAARRVVLTNYASAEVRAQCLALGAERVFDKSSDIEALVDYCAALASVAAGGSAP